MLEIVIPENELFDESTQEFIEVPSRKIVLEHSLVSMSKWESIWEKPFLKELTENGLSSEEMLSYVKCMTVTKGVPELTYLGLNDSVVSQINEYINKPMTATTFSSYGTDQHSGRGTVLTSEVLYHQMIIYGIPFECQKWHLNRLFALIKVCSIKNAPPKKVNKAEAARRYAELNAARRRKYHTKG